MNLKDRYLVLHIKDYQEGYSSNYAHVSLYKIHSFGNENERQEFLEEMKLYGNDEFDDGNSYRSIELDEIFKCVGCEDIEEFTDFPFNGKIIQYGE